VKGRRLPKARVENRESRSVTATATVRASIEVSTVQRQQSVDGRLDLSCCR